MGLAWFDAEAPPMKEATLRTGGLPLLGDPHAWPCCPACELPMLFRAQIPLALTSLAPPTDERLLLAFECHARLDGNHCQEAALVVTTDPGAPCVPPARDRHDLLLLDWGKERAELLRVVRSLVECGDEIDLERAPPLVLMRGMNGAAGQAAAELLRQRGGAVELQASPPLILTEARGGHLVPFDDDIPNTSRTTLPPLRVLKEEVGAVVMRGLIGGATPGYRDQAKTCPECSAPTRTALRMLADQTHSLGLPLGISVVQFCVPCGSGSLHRHG